MGRLETFDHTADVGLRLWGDNPNDLFQTAAEALFDYVVVNRDEVRPVELEWVSLESDSMGDLLVDWLSELIFRSETQHRLYSRFKVEVAPDGKSLRADIGGEAIDADRHVLDHEVKAVTRHGLVFRREGTGYFAEMILDI
jgi:SHS2 domain-containing protein